jgi:hypothetical protein
MRPAVYRIFGEGGAIFSLANGEILSLSDELIALNRNYFTTINKALIFAVIA